MEEFGRWRQDDNRQPDICRRITGQRLMDGRGGQFELHTSADVKPVELEQEPYLPRPQRRAATHLLHLCSCGWLSQPVPVCAVARLSRPLVRTYTRELKVWLHVQLLHAII